MSFHILGYWPPMIYFHGDIALEWPTLRDGLISYHEMGLIQVIILPYELCPFIKYNSSFQVFL
jgi:hypothetical protein